MWLLSYSFKSLEGFDDFLVYFNLTYVNGTSKSITIECGTTRSLQHRPTFSQHMWNVYNSTKEGYGRAYNVSGGFNYKLKNVWIKYSNLNIFIESIQMSMCNTCLQRLYYWYKKKNEIISVPKKVSF